MVIEQIVRKTDEEWKKQLTPEQYEVCRRKGTELPFSGEYYNSKEKGVYRCVCCGNELFSSDNKFESGTGWPSFTQPIKFENVERKLDLSHGMIRKEVHLTKKVKCIAQLQIAKQKYTFPKKPLNYTKLWKKMSA
jgi:peptide-methionine (R)-S-oxide reductase